VTSGEAQIEGHSVIYDHIAVRQIIGVCPQHNVLFEELTVLENIKFFGMLKGLENPELENEVQRLIKAVCLEEKTNVQAEKLSGGMKRKLTLAIALIGHPKVLFLDEPTTGEQFIQCVD
jgi:ATP-binding cassette subfamily A (ABC1) protein 3